MNYPVGLTPRSLALADVDGINGLDLITSNELGNSVSILKNNGNGTFATAVTVALGTSPYALTAKDLTGDGRPEIIVTLQDTDQIAILKNNGSGGFTVRAARIVAEVSPFSSLYLQRSRTNRTQRQRHRQAVSDIARQ